MIKLLLLICLASVSFVTYGQSALSVSVPVIFSDVTVKNNWTPPTAPFYKEYLTGTAIGYGFNVGYSFQPKLFIKSTSFFVNVGMGYYNQKINISRPFDYPSFIEIIYTTDYYSYQNLHWSGGLSYRHLLKKRLFLNYNVSYNRLRSYRQEYKPTSNNWPSYISKNKIDFGKSFSLSISLQPQIKNNFLISIDLIAQYTQWRNDKIFQDDPSSFSAPFFSMGTAVGLVYLLNQNAQVKTNFKKTSKQFNK